MVCVCENWCLERPFQNTSFGATAATPSSPSPSTDRPEARQLRMCLLSKRVKVMVLRRKAKEAPFKGLGLL